MLKMSQLNVFMMKNEIDLVNMKREKNVVWVTPKMCSNNIQEQKYIDGLISRVSNVLKKNSNKTNMSVHINKQFDRSNCSIFR